MKISKTGQAFILMGLVLVIMFVYQWQPTEAESELQFAVNIIYTDGTAETVGNGQSLSIMYGDKPIQSVSAKVQLYLEFVGIVQYASFEGIARTLFGNVGKQQVALQIPSVIESGQTHVLAAVKVIESDMFAWANGVVGTHTLSFQVPSGSKLTITFTDGTVDSRTFEEAKAVIDVNVESDSSITVADVTIETGATEPPDEPPDGVKINGLTIALDTLGSTSAQTIINFMKQYNYNGLRIYMGWCNSFWTGNINDPMNTNTKTYIDDLCRLCKDNNFYVVCAVSDQVSPWKTFAHEEIQVGPNGEENSQGNWVCPTGPKFQTFTKSLIVTLVDIMEKYATPIISVDEIVFITAGGRPAFYSDSMKAYYLQQTGNNIPTFTSTSGSYNSEQQDFIDFATDMIRDFYVMTRNTAKGANPNVIFQALVDTYWVYPRTSYDTQPWDFYGSSNLDEITYEWFYATQEENWAGITDGLQRIKNLNPQAKHYFIYGTSTMTSITNMRKTVELAMAEDYDGVFLYEYAKSRNNPFDVSDLVFS